MSGEELLKHHLRWIEQDKLEVSEKLFGHNLIEKTEYEAFMDAYSKFLAQKMNAVSLQPQDLPLVMISSTVTVEDEEDGERMDFKIISPNAFGSHGSLNLASYLSPVGKSMLLRKKSERVEVKTPQGVFYYKILHIKYDLH